MHHKTNAKNPTALSAGGVFRNRHSKMTAYFITNPTDYPLKCRGFPGSLRREVNVSGRAKFSDSQFNRDGKGRISDTRVLCAVVVTQRGIVVFVAVETRARPVHSLTRFTGTRRQARTSGRSLPIELHEVLCMAFLPEES